MNYLGHTDIPRRSLHCVKGEERFTPGMDYYSLLIYEDECFKRFDCCVKCWPEWIAAQDLTQGHSFWKSRVEAKKEIKVNQTKEEQALDLLKAKMAQPDSDAAEIFMLALYYATK
jgi:hypothetical protein